jgi:hypothetical protein
VIGIGSVPGVAVGRKFRPKAARCREPQFGIRRIESSFSKDLASPWIAIRSPGSRQKSPRSRSVLGARRTPRFANWEGACKGSFAEVAESWLVEDRTLTRPEGKGASVRQSPVGGQALSRSRGAFLAILGRIYRDLRPQTGPRAASRCGFSRSRSDDTGRLGPGILAGTASQAR